MTQIEQATFDYSELTPDKSKFVQAVTKEIRERMGKAAQNVFEIGSRLVEVKERLNHGQFGCWLAAEFEWGHATAAKMMQVASKFPHCGNLKIAPSALYLLASDSVPDDVRSDFMSRAEAGESITHAEVKKAVSKTISATHYRESDGEVIDDLMVEKVTVKAVKNKEADPNEDDRPDTGTVFRAAPSKAMKAALPHSAPAASTAIELPHDPSRAASYIHQIFGAEFAKSLMSELSLLCE